MQLPHGCSQSQRFLLRAQGAQAREGRPRERGSVALACKEVSASKADSSDRRADLIARVDSRPDLRHTPYLHTLLLGVHTRSVRTCILTESRREIFVPGLCWLPHCRYEKLRSGND